MKTKHTHAEKRRYKIESGRASWHQQRAGHFFACSIIGDYTGPELESFLANIKARNEPFLVSQIPALSLA
jgi:hypothetical protein